MNSPVQTHKHTHTISHHEFCNGVGCFLEKLLEVLSVQREHNHLGDCRDRGGAFAVLNPACVTRVMGMRV